MIIDKDIPLPSKVRGRKAKYKFAEMEVGDSFFAEGDSSVQVSILTCAKRHLPKRFVTQKAEQKGTQTVSGIDLPDIKQGFRCWRAE
jgi:hypothetical protein